MTNETNLNLVGDLMGLMKVMLSRIDLLLLQALLSWLVLLLWLVLLPLLELLTWRARKPLLPGAQCA